MSLLYSPRLKDIINKSKLVAKENGRNIINPIDLLISCLNSGFEPIIYFVNSELNGYTEFFEMCREKSESIKKDKNKKISWTKESILCIDSAEKEALEREASFVGVEHLFASLIKRSSQIRRFLDYLDIDNKSLYVKFWEEPKEEPSEFAPSNKSSLQKEDSIIEDMWDRISDSNFKFYGRTQELERMMSILCRRKKSNILLIGEPGVGKTALVEGLVNAMNNPPEDSDIAFIRMNVFELNISNLLSDTIFRGQFEKKLNSVLDQVTESEPKGVLFIDEFHMAMKAGDSFEGGVNAINILKPALADGSLSLIGATTFSEFKKYVEKDPALVRRFEIINVSEPSKDEAFDILWNCKSFYEEYHNFNYSKEFIESIIDVADKYLPYKKFPDKAFEILDDISSFQKLSIFKKPKSLLKVEKELIAATEILENVNLDDEGVEDFVETYEKKLEDYQYKTNGYIKSISKIRDIKIEALDKYVKEKFNDSSINATLQEKLLSNVFGQDNAVKSVYKSIFMYNSINRKNKPIVSMLFAGNKSCGKKLLANYLADSIGYSKKKIVIDMSRYNQPDSIYNFIGQNKNDINGHNSLFESIKRNPSSVVILDNIESCTQSIKDVVSQIIENGKIADSYGLEIDFSRSVIICITSAVKKESSLGFGGNNDDMILDDSKVKSSFSSLFDEIILFNALNKESLSKIVKKITSSVSIDFSIEIDDSVYDLIAKASFKKAVGASSVDRDVKEMLISPMFSFIADNDMQKKSKILAKVLDNSISFSII